MCFLLDTHIFLLVAQAIAEPLKLLTGDAVLAKYSDIVVLV